MTPTVGLPHDAIKYVEVYGHRGARSLSPENTIPAFRTALSVGVDWIDVDIGMTSDGILICVHDNFLDPNFTSLNGEFLSPDQTNLFFYKLTLDQIKKYDVGTLNPNLPYGLSFPDQIPVPGTQIPTLQEMVDYVQKITHQMHFQIEIKNDPTTSKQQFADPLYAFLKANDLIDRCEIQSFDWGELYELQRLDPRIKTAYLIIPGSSVLDPNPTVAAIWSGGKSVKDYNHSYPQMVKALGGACYEPVDTYLTKADLDECHSLGLKVVTWPSKPTFDPVLARTLIEWGVDGMIVDDPSRLNSMLAQFGLQVPPRYCP